MNKKQIAALVETMVQTLVTQHAEMTDDTARTLVGLSIQKNSEALLQISVPTLSVAAA